MPPSDAVSVAVSAGLGVSVVVGVVSGLCYVLVQGFAGRRRIRDSPSNNPWQCGVCGCHFRSIDGILEVSKVVTCGKCGARICRARCSERDGADGGWVCSACRRSSRSWFGGILRAVRPSQRKEVRMTMCDRLDEIDEDLEKLRKREKEQVRDFIERLVSAMLGGDVDDACVTKLYNDSRYDAMFAKYHSDLSSALTDLGSALHISIANLPVTGQTPCSAHAALKQLIQRMILEALELPRLREAEHRPEEVGERTYEDLLATAVLNKVIQNYQDDRPSSSANSTSSHPSKPPQNKEYFFGNETLDSKYKRSNPDAADSDSLSSLEDIARSESSFGSVKYVDRMTLTIRQSIEERSNSEEESEEEAEPVYLHTASSLFSGEDLDFEDNWRLQRRKYTTSSSPVPVPMLVPNPTGEAKVFIGDREAENTSDLSDVGSDYGDGEAPVPTVNSVLVDSKTVIGGKNLLCFDGADGDQEEAHVPNGMANGVAEKGADNGIVLAGEGVEESSLDSHTEKDTEYTERYASLPRTILKSPLPKPRITKQTMEEQHYELPLEGTYSAREKEKWKHPVSMKYNPYSKENIERRLSSRSSGSGAGSPYGRDYYVREASKPKGARRAKSEINESSADHSLPLTSPPKEESASRDFLVKAVPAKVQEEPLSRPDSLTLDVQTAELSSDSDLSIERAYNPITGEITEKLPTDENHNDVKEHSSLTEGDDPVNLTYEDFLGGEDVEKNLVPSKIHQYEQINGSTTLQLSRSSLNSTPKPAPRNQRTHGEPQTMIGSEDQDGGRGSKTPESLEEELRFESSTPDISLELQTSRVASSLETDAEITDLQEKHLVKSILGKFSRSFPNLTKISSASESTPSPESKSADVSFQEANEELSVLPSVQDLKKKFEDSAKAKQAKQDNKVVYSLTARSIPRQLRQELKHQEETETSLQGSLDVAAEKEKTEIEVEKEITEEHIPNTKSTIEFFETLGKGKDVETDKPVQ